MFGWFAPKALPTRFEEVIEIPSEIMKIVAHILNMMMYALCWIIPKYPEDSTKSSKHKFSANSITSEGMAYFEYSKIPLNESWLNQCQEFSLTVSV